MAGQIELSFHGAAQTVTGSCMELAMRGRRILVDCGMFQGSRGLERLNHEPFGFDPRKIDAVVVTHAHIDHSGLLPRLVAKGFSGPIWCTEPTRDLLEYMLADSARIQEGDVMRRNRRKDRAGEPPFEALYDEQDVAATMELIECRPLDTWFEPVEGVRARMWNAGHILGSASIEIAVDETRLLFSGDLGPESKAFYPDPEGPKGVDFVICESTYGDRDRPATSMAERRALLEAEIRGALAHGGNLVIPVFAVERTQELLLDIAHIVDSGAINHPAVFIDSPLASRTTSVFARHSDELEDLGDGDVFRHPSFHFVENVQKSMRLNTISGAIIMAASGMCEAGRIRHHLFHNLARSDSTILFVGYQAEGSLGRTILEGARRVRISGREVTVKANIRRIESYSAHADRGDLIGWIKDRAPIRGSLFLDHGEATALASLKEAVSGDAPSVITPAIGERYRLAAGEPAHRVATGRTDVENIVGRDWQNDYADFAVNLKRELATIRDDKRRREAISRMRRVLDDYREFRNERRRR